MSDHTYVMLHCRAGELLSGTLIDQEGEENPLRTLGPGEIKGVLIPDGWELRLRMTKAAEGWLKKIGADK